MLAAGFDDADLSRAAGRLGLQDAAAARRVLAGDRGAHRDIVLLNAAAGLVVADAVNDIEQGLELAARSIDSGDAAATLQRFVDVSQACAAEAADAAS